MPTLRSLKSLSPILPVRSIPRALAFYQRLGFAAQPYTAGPDDYAFLTRDNLELHLRHAPTLPAENPAGVYFYLHPGAGAALQAEFLAAGVSILSPLAPREWKMLEFILADPDHNLLRFGEPAHTEDRG